MIELVIDKRKPDPGGGFEVGRLPPFAKRRMVRPVIIFDSMGPNFYRPSSIENWMRAGTRTSAGRLLAICTMAR